jgi:DNA ligase 1
MFEKYDGVRGFWNPLKKQIYSRQGNVLHLPQEVIDAMPSDLFLDGELW